MCGKQIGDEHDREEMQCRAKGRVIENTLEGTGIGGRSTDYPELHVRAKIVQKYTHIAYANLRNTPYKCTTHHTETIRMCVSCTFILCLHQNGFTLENIFVHQSFNH